MKTTDNIITFNYDDVFFAYYLNDACECSHLVRDHCLCYIYSGEFILHSEGREQRYTAGDCVFCRRDNRLEVRKGPLGNEQFRGVFMNFKRPFLKEMYKRIDHSKFPRRKSEALPAFVQMPQSPDFQSLFRSMTPYFDSNVHPSENLMRLKQMEGVYALIDYNADFGPLLFDFADQWRPDLVEFMERNFMCDMTLEDFAQFSGRSLSTFKRDFKKIFDLPPERWLTQKRLNAAYEMLQQGATVTDACFNVGFKNISHFSNAFKREFGVSPLEIKHRCKINPSTSKTY
ncbi:MAG: helix-turn-helix transcriptional regulator [Muribaculaceae bacterium]|nr:helix-turn-helix transcriptional regulator [Muribaculaceae bacterium]